MILRAGYPLNKYVGCTDIAIDNLGRIWVGGGDVNCDGLHMFDGTKWLDIESPINIEGFAVDSKGQVWTFLRGRYPDEPSVSVYNGQEWKTFSSQDLGISSDGWQLVDIETSPAGRIWVEANYYKDILNYKDTGNNRNFLLLENGTWKLYSSEISGLPESVFGFIKSDNEGRIWVVYWDNAFNDQEPGLYVFDGEHAKEILYNGEKIKDRAITFDDQNNLWIATQCGGIREYTNNTWKTYLECGNGRYPGIYLDHQGRIWLYGLYGLSSSLGIYDGEALKTLTSENSGLAGDYNPGISSPGVYGLVVDALDRVWILTEEDIKMIPVKNIQTLPQELVDRWNRAMDWDYFLEQNFPLVPIELVLVWIMVLLNLNARQGVRVTDVDTQSAREIKRQAKTSLVFGNLSLGTFMVRLSFGISGPNYSEILAYLVFPLLFLLTTLGGIVGLVTAASALRKIKKEDGDSYNMVKKTVYRGVALSLLGIAFIIIASLRAEGIFS